MWPLTLSVQLPKTHGDDAHSSMSVLHSAPVKPEAQKQKNALLLSMQEAPFPQGDEEHSVIVSEHVGPANGV